MSYRELHPHPALRPYVDRFWLRGPDPDGSATDGATAAARAVPPVRIMPDGCIDVLVDVPSGAARVVGTMTRAVTYDGEPGAMLAAVRFRPGGAQPFLRVPAVELTDKVLAARDLAAGWLDVRGVVPATPRAVIAGLERALLERLHAVGLDRNVCHATQRLLAPAPPRIDALARELRHSRQHLARLFREHVGVSPKEFARVARLQRALSHLQCAPGEGLASAALALGYYDQAHMTRDFNDIAGLTPHAAREERDSIFPIRSLWLDA
jgi:AraC-like DNA-binding protein